MKNWQEINSALAEAYGTYVPDYDLTPVLQLISLIDPKEFTDTITEAIISLVDGLMTGVRKPNRRSQDTMANLKLIYRAFECIHFDKRKFYENHEKMIEDSSIFCDGELQFIYPSLD